MKNSGGTQKVSKKYTHKLSVITEITGIIGF
jgi:hypothetical protein